MERNEPPFVPYPGPIVTFHFKDKFHRDVFMGQLSDGWGEGAGVSLDWNWPQEDFDETFRFNVDPCEEDLENSRRHIRIMEEFSLPEAVNTPDPKFGNMWRCPYCNAWDKSLDGAKNGPYNCDECGKRFRLNYYPQNPCASLCCCSRTPCPDPCMGKFEDCCNGH